MFVLRNQGAIYIFETLRCNGYPKEWLALYMESIMGAALLLSGMTRKGRHFDYSWA